MSVFAPPIGLRGPHVQSIIARVGLRRARVRALARPFLEASEDLIADVGDGVRLLVHHTPPPDSTSGRQASRTAVLLHGWEGSAMATYVLSTSMRLWDAGYRIVRINLRDHGPSHHLNEELFHSCRLDEVSGAVAWVQARFPEEKLVLVGSSLGGNFALRIAARATDEKKAEEEQQGPDMKIMFLMVGGVVFLFWMSSSKQRKQRKKQQQMLAGLSKGDKVVSIGGICGTIAQLSEEEVVVKIDGDMKMTFLRSAIRTQETIGEKK